MKGSDFSDVSCLSCHVLRYKEMANMRLTVLFACRAHGLQAAGQRRTRAPKNKQVEKNTFTSSQKLQNFLYKFYLFFKGTSGVALSFVN